MVKARDINKDIKVISEKVGTAVFAYEDIFHPNVKNEFHYDFKKVIGEYARVQQISLEESEQRLNEIGVLSPLPNGEYKIEVGGTTRNGGGLNYQGEVFFSFNQKDYRTKYHELAHSLQKEYNLFNHDTIKPQYDIAEKGLSDEQKSELLMSKDTYHQYLNEMHSESFSYAAMMLRASNGLDFIRQVSAAYNAGEGRNLVALLSFGKTEYGTDSQNSAKFYATRPVMKATIKAIRKIRKEGKVGEFFDENGVLRDEKLAKLCENIVMKSAYSPRTLNSFFNYNIQDEHNSEEHGWRLDAIKSMIQMPTTGIMILVHESGIFNTIRKIADHYVLKKITERKLNKYIKTPNKCDNPEMQALKEYERLQFKLTQMDQKFPNEYLSSRIKDKLPVIADHHLHDTLLHNMADTKMEKSSSSPMMYKHLTELNQIIEHNRSNPYFKQLLHAQPETQTLRAMIKDLEQYPQKKVFDAYNLQPKRIHQGLMTYGLKINMNKINNFAEKYNISPAIKRSLLNTFIHNPKLLKYNSTRQKLSEAHQIKGDILGIKKKQFDKELNQLADTLYANFYYHQDNPKYKASIDELQKIPLDQNFETACMEKITELEKVERAESDAHKELRKKAYTGLDKMENSMEQQGEEYHQATLETVKSFAALDKAERNEILKDQLLEIKETLEPLVAKLPERALYEQEIADLKIELVQKSSPQSETQQPTPEKSTPEKESASKQEAEKPAQQDKTKENSAPKQEKTVTTPSKADKARLAELSGRTGPTKPATKAQDDASKTQDAPTKTQDGKAEIRPDAELKFATPMQTSDLPPAPVVVQTPSQDEYDKFASQNADSKLRKLCEDLRGKDEKLYTQVVTEWNRQYYENPPKDIEQGDQIAQNVMMQYKKDLEPLVIDQIQKDITPQNTANVDTTKLDQAKDDLQQKDPTARAEAVAELNKQTENTTNTADLPQPTAFKEQMPQQQGEKVNAMRHGHNLDLEKSANYVPNTITAPTRTAPQPQQTNTAAFNLAQATKTADTGRGSY